MESNLIVALIAATSALFGSLIPTAFGYFSNKKQREFEVLKSLQENQKESYTNLLLTLEEVMSSPSLEKLAAFQRAVILISIYGDDKSAQAANSYFKALVNSQLPKGTPLSKDQHQTHHEKILSGVRTSLGLNSLKGFELISIPRKK